MKAVIFDLDGTLANIDHRLHHVKNGNKNYDAFFEECDKDLPKQNIIDLLNTLNAHGYAIIICSGRSDIAFEKTKNWLQQHKIVFDLLFMRKADDHRSDVIIKSEMLELVLNAGYEIEFVVDDRQSVVDMWRARGLTCLQCEAWSEQPKSKLKGKLAIMVGTAGAGKSTWLKNSYFNPSHIISSDQIRADLCGDFRDQSKNIEVFQAVHEIAKARLSNGLPTVIDATHLRRKDRLAAVELANGGEVVYIVIDRPIEEKRRDGGWRNEIPDFDLIGKHQQTFKSQLKEILRGDDQPNVTVLDERQK